MTEKEKLLKSIEEISNCIVNYQRDEAIKLIRRVRIEHRGLEQIAYVESNVKLEDAKDYEIINTLEAEKFRLMLKLQ